MSRTVIRHVRDYGEARKKEYPPLEDFADAYYHMVRGNSSLMETYLAKIEEVKTRIPKISSGG